MTHHITLLAYDHCYTSGVTSILDVLYVANRYWQSEHPEQSELFTWQVVSHDGKPVMTTSRLLLPVDAAISDADPTSIIVVPGTIYKDRAHFAQVIDTVNATCGSWLRERKQQGTTLAACCTAAFFLAECDLVEGCAMTTTWWLEADFRQHYPDIELRIDELIIDNGSVISAGSAPYLDLAFYLIEKYAGRYLALDCARLLLVDANRSSQSPYIMLQAQARHNDDLVLAAQNWMSRNQHLAFTMQELANEMGVSQRTLIRRFKQAIGVKPTTYLQDVRVETAKRLLENATLSLEELVCQIGYVDVSSFRRLFKQRTKMTPRDYRLRFAAQSRRS